MTSYNNRVFASVSNSINGEIDDQTIFSYSQEGNIVSAVYSGGNIIYGQLLAIADQEGKLDMRYQHINISNIIMTGRCISTPEILENGKIRLHEKWKWTSGDLSEGESVIEEIEG